MNKIILLCFLCSLMLPSGAQKQTYDLVNFVPPTGWKSEVKNNIISYTSTNASDNTWCQIFIVKSTISKGSIDADFESEWQELAVKNFHPPEPPHVGETQEADGWKVKAGIGKFVFNKHDAVVMLTTASGYNRCLSIVTATNSGTYQKDIDSFLATVILLKPEANNGQSSTATAPFIGSWGKSNLVSQGNNQKGNYSYNKQQYVFNADGSYGFAAKTYDEKQSETFLIRETGNFVINGNTITITPVKSVLEAWSKKNGADNWNQLKSIQNRPLEIVTYQFSLPDKNLQLQTDKPTQRDGYFNTGHIYTYGPAGTFTPIIFPEGNQLTLKEIRQDPVLQPAVQTVPSVSKDGFAFNTTQFDDGWTSTVQEDWVEVIKGSMKVLLHYPKDGTIFPADPDKLINAAWNILVAPRYSNLHDYKTAYIATYDRPYLGMGYATENTSGRNVFIVFFRQGQSGWLEFIAPDKNSFIQLFKFDPASIQWDSNSDLMLPLANMTGYNKFAVAASDLKGKWTSDFSGIQQMYNVYTGQYAGMNMNQSNEEFAFGGGNSYTWKFLAVNGMVGNARVSDAKSSGQFTVPNNWQVQFSNIENRARTFNAFWSCIKGGRILNLLDANAPGSGIYTKYGLAK